eukprot:CAMPEP_0119320848 /NCGR_PEP_ID=MMETSP1333-20130426/53717_1 /TAXON_ID=418940 /ORGANISM="Scyphosphaera apsteinii, Strain RCC1455" /LENGTH=500 /DNA_ID=CAMNT_0007327665 /DNA_START=47 /DNA_END=1546 /DNA_ORIENTATION=-
MVDVAEDSVGRRAWLRWPIDVGIGERRHWSEALKQKPEFGHFSHGHHEPIWASNFYHVPQLRFQWGTHKEELHAGAKDLFLDLIFVGIAYEVGVSLKSSVYLCDDGGHGYESSSDQGSGSDHGSNYRQLGMAGAPLAPCDGLWFGLLHALAPFMAAFMMWGIETRYNARFARNSLVHQALDILSYVFMILIASNTQYVVASRRSHIDSHRGLSACLFWSICNLTIWIIRHLELALFSVSECVRRETFSEVFGMLQVLMLYAIALSLSLIDFDDEDTTKLTSDIAVALIWLGNTLYLLERCVRIWFFIMFPESALPLERSVCPMSQTFEYHRNNELKFIMLGEAVLQMVITERADISHNFGDSIANQHNAVLVCSFIIAWSMLVSFRHVVEAQIQDRQYINEEVHLSARLTQHVRDTLGISDSSKSHGHHKVSHNDVEEGGLTNDDERHAASFFWNIRNNLGEVIELQHDYLTATKLVKNISIPKVIVRLRVRSVVMDILW